MRETRPDDWLSLAKKFLKSSWTLTFFKMDVQQGYNNWAQFYDGDKNKTRDLEAFSLRETVADIPYAHCLELGCGTGKNTQWLMTRDGEVTAVDFSEKMLEKAREKINSDKVRFVQADISGDWTFADKKYDLITCSLVLEHMEDLDPVFQKASLIAAPHGYLYIGELHPFKQYLGTRARFGTGDEKQILPCFNHHVSDFVRPALAHGFEVKAIREYFAGDRADVPRILVILLKKK
jgi:ubiquinone/menaquinone biosynthesis C-methylase UbiE